ncbi:mucin-5AC-like [Amphibalanus amphitrite]|uniref:mucin-5AC-like n=1 Tax=Amphibalanus amphitrite TaxID=1232801 RepID=UPI001C8FAA34|nr:mucin-5AC-like [Amphibalanus amphitrite]
MTDLAAANAALSARLLQTAGGGHKRHVTRPQVRPPPQLPPGGDPAAALKVIRRRKVLAPRAQRRDDVTSSDDVTERTFRESLRPPFLALLNDTHFSLQPEFVLAHASEHKVEPFRGFGEKLDTPGVAGRPRDFRAVPRSDGSGAQRANSTAEEGLVSEPSERHGKVIVRRKKVRVVNAKDSADENDQHDEEVQTGDKSGEKKTPEEASTSNVSQSDEKDLQNPAAKSIKPETTTEKSTAGAPPKSDEKSDEIGIVPRRIASKRRPGRLLVPLSKTTNPPPPDEPAAGRKVKSEPAVTSIGKDSSSTTEKTTSAPDSEVSSPSLRRRPPGINRSTTTPRTSTTTSPSTTSSTTPSITKSPARRRLSEAALRRRERFRNRASRLRPNGTTTAVSTTEATPVNKEKKEVEKVLGLLARIRNRSRARLSFLPKRRGEKDKEPTTTSTAATPSSAPTSEPRSTSTTSTTTTEAATTTTTTSATTTTTPSTTTTAKTTTTTETTTTTSEATSASTSTSTTPTTTTLRTTTRPTTTEQTTQSTTTTTSSPSSSATTETNSQSSTERTTLPSSTISSTPQITTPSTLPTQKETDISSPAVPANPLSTKRRQRPDTLRHTPSTTNTDKSNLLARRLEERRHTFSLRSGPKAGQRHVLPPTIPPFPLLLSTIKSAQQRGLLGRNVTISVTFPRGTLGLPRGRPVLPGPRTSPAPPSPAASEASSKELPTVTPAQIPVSKIESENQRQKEDEHQVSKLDEQSNDTSPNETSSQAGNDTDIQRTVLGTSLETSVSIAVSPLEFKLRKRVKLPTDADEEATVTEYSPTDTSQRTRRPLNAVLSSQAPLELDEAKQKEDQRGTYSILIDNRSSSTGSVPVSSQRPLVLESSVIRTTEAPIQAHEETESSQTRGDKQVSIQDLPSSANKDWVPKADESVIEKQQVPKVDNSAKTESDALSVRFGLKPGRRPDSQSSTIANPSTNKFSDTHGHSYHSHKDHSYVQGFSPDSDNGGIAQLKEQKRDSQNFEDRESFIPKSSNEGYGYISDDDLELDTGFPDYEPDDLAASASTTMATFLRPSETEMERILSAENSELPPTSPSGPVVHYADHHQPVGQSPSSETSATPASPPSVEYSTSSTSSPTQSSSTTPRQARVLEIDRKPQVVSPRSEEVEEPGGPIYLVSLLFVVPVVAVLVWYLKKNHPDVQNLLPERLKAMMAQETSDNAQENFYPVEVDEVVGKPSTSHSHDTLARRRRWEHPRETLRLQSVLGEGHFGQVWRAEVDNIGGHQGTLLVAVKNAKESATAKEHQDLLRELRIMQDLGSHPNVVTLLGCCTTEEPVLVIMEYMVFGKLLTYLRENRGRHNYYNFSHDSAVLTSPDLTLFACQVAAGMEYIAGKGIVHRDLAARNILVDHTKVCKVSDFGMSRSVKEISAEVFEQKHRGALPIRWMSPESLYHNTFNQQTDCWSFGILLWEIITLGSTPYPGLSAREVMRSVREGYRLERPDHCHPQLYQLASSCWAAEPSWRPTFTELRNELETLLEDQNQGYVDLDRFQEEIYSTLHKSSDEKV